MKEKSSEITNLKEDIGKKVKNIKQLITSREGAMQETQKLLLHMQSLEETYKNKVTISFLFYLEGGLIRLGAF